VSTTARGAKAVTSADIDRNGTPDLVVASCGDDTVAWYSQVPGSATFERHVVGSVVCPWAVVTADLAASGWTDIVSAAADSGVVTWHRNGGGGQGFTSVPLGNNMYGACGLAIGDVDGNGVLDVAVVASYSNFLAWISCVWGTTASTTVCTIHRVTTLTLIRPSSVALADMTGSGRLSLVTASYGDNKVCLCVE
jgi:hypothetical protein